MLKPYSLLRNWPGLSPAASFGIFFCERRGNEDYETHLEARLSLLPQHKDAGRFGLLPALPRDLPFTPWQRKRANVRQSREGLLLNYTSQRPGITKEACFELHFAVTATATSSSSIQPSRTAPQSLILVSASADTRSALTTSDIETPQLATHVPSIREQHGCHTSAI